MKIAAQRLRSLTTGRLHTPIIFVYEDLAAIMGERGLMSHMIPRVMIAVEPWLRQHVTDERFWNGAYDSGHEGCVDLPEPTAEDRIEMVRRYRSQPDTLVHKDVIGAVIGEGPRP